MVRVLSVGVCVVDLFLTTERRAERNQMMKLVPACHVVRVCRTGGLQEGCASGGHEEDLVQGT